MKRFLLTTAGASLVMLTACNELDLGGRAFADAGSASSQRVQLITGAGSVGSTSRDVRLIGGDINTTLDTAENARVAGADVRLTGQVGGALEIAAAELVLDDVTAGSLDVAAADMRFSGSVSGPTRVRAADLYWGGTANGPLTIAAADLEFNGRAGVVDAQVADASFTGEAGDMSFQSADLVFERGFTAESVRADAAEFLHRGALRGGLDLQARTVQLEGSVDGDLALYVDPGRRPHRADDGRVDISGAVAGGFVCARTVSLSGPVNGPLTVISDEQPSLSGAAEAADISYTPRNGQRCERGMED
ncbi:MAG: hypothetical protein RIA71_09770 [Oceanicaulis sp.]